MSQPCGCTVESLSNNTFVPSYIIDYCPKHQAVDELVEACKQAKKDFVYSNRHWESETVIDSALAKAEEE